jgi:hypothetical protein
MSRSPSPLLLLLCPWDKKRKKQDKSKQADQEEQREKKHNLIKHAYIACPVLLMQLGWRSKVLALAALPDEMMVYRAAAKEIKNLENLEWREG